MLATSYGEPDADEPVEDEDVLDEDEVLDDGPIEIARRMSRD
jgi:hypothetical protein